MCDASADAPALVPARTTPRSCAFEIASPSRVPATTCVSRDWFPPVRNTPVACARSATVAGSFGLFPLLGADAAHLSDPEPEEELAVGLRRGLAQR